MTLRAKLREKLRQITTSQPTRPAQAVRRIRRSHLHLIRRDGREGLFLPIEAPINRLANRARATLTQPTIQRGGAA